MKRASYLVTHNVHIALAKYNGTNHEGSGTSQHHPQITPPAASTDTTAGTPAPPNTEHSCSPEGDDPKGSLRRMPQLPPLGPQLILDQHRVALGASIPKGDDPEGDLHESKEASDCSTPLSAPSL